MTFQELCMKHLTDNMMREDQAEKVCESYLTGTLGSNMVGHFNKDVSGYPSMMKSVVLRGITMQAVTWLRENAVQAFYLPVFMVLTGNNEWDTIEKCAEIQKQWTAEQENKNG